MPLSTFKREKLLGALSNLKSSTRRTIILTIAGATVFGISQPLLWPGGWGIGSEKTVTTTSIEKDKQGNVVKTIEVTQNTDGKTFWDLLSLAGVPLSLAVLGYWLQQNQQKRAEAISREQRELAADETKEEVLQAYFDRISALVVDKNVLAIATKLEIPQSRQSVSTEEKELLDAASDVIRARTLSILRRFENDPERKTSVIRFLIETDIVSKLRVNLSEDYLSGEQLEGAELEKAELEKAFLPWANLTKANLTKANLEGAILTWANLTRANLTRANLEGAILTGANLEGAYLEGAYLEFSHLEGVNLEHASLQGAYLERISLEEANLAGANLAGADISEAYLAQTNLAGANLAGANLAGANLAEANLAGANLAGAYLEGAYLEGANLAGANLAGADLEGAILEGANLAGADLRDSRNVTFNQLVFALLCQTKLPEDSTRDPDRDCEKLRARNSQPK